jgi:adenylate cyclase
MLIDRGAIYKQGNSWAAGKEIGTIEIPDNLQGLLLARIDRLPDDVKRTLRVASVIAVIGRQFSVRVLEQVLERLQ